MMTLSRRPIRKVLVAVTLLALAGGGAYALQQRGSATAQTAPRLATVSKADFEKTVLASGVVETATLVSVGARVSGRIEKLLVGVGDVVAAGDLIVTIESLDQENALLRAQAQLQELEAGADAQKASIQLAELDLARKRELNNRNLNTKVELEQAEASLDADRANLRATEARIAQARLSVKDAELALERTRIVSPVAGTVVAVVANEGSTVNAAQTTPTIVKIADLQHMTVRAAISEADVIGVRAGMPARFTLQGGEARPFEAELAYVEPAPASIRTSDEISSDSAIYYDAVLRTVNRDGVLRIGMTAEVTITLAGAKDALALPSAALGARAGRGLREVQVWSVETESAEPRVVEIGLETGGMTQVVSGLKLGDQVVLNGTAAAPAARGNAGGRSSAGPRAMARGGLPGF